MEEMEKLYNLLKETFILLDGGDRQLLGDYNLTVPRFYVLVHIGDEPGLSLSQLSDVMRCDKCNITRIIKGLEADGYIIRRRHETDGRASRLFLTELGEAKRKEVLAAHKAYNVARLQSIPDAERKALLHSLTKIKNNLLIDLPETAV